MLGCNDHRSINYKMFEFKSKAFEDLTFRACTFVIRQASIFSIVLSPIVQSLFGVCDS